MFPKTGSWAWQVATIVAGMKNIYFFCEAETALVIQLACYCLMFWFLLWHHHLGIYCSFRFPSTPRLHGHSEAGVDLQTQTQRSCSHTPSHLLSYVVSLSLSHPITLSLSLIVEELWEYGKLSPIKCCVWIKTCSRQGQCCAGTITTTASRH